MSPPGLTERGRQRFFAVPAPFPAISIGFECLR